MRWSSLDVLSSHVVDQLRVIKTLTSPFGNLLAIAQNNDPIAISRTSSEFVADK